MNKSRVSKGLRQNKTPQRIERECKDMDFIFKSTDNQKETPTQKSRGFLKCLLPCLQRVQTRFIFF